MVYERKNEFLKSMAVIVNSMEEMCDMYDNVYKVFDCGYPFSVSFEEIIFNLAIRYKVQIDKKWRIENKSISEKARLIKMMVDVIDMLSYIERTPDFEKYFNDTMPKLFDRNNNVSRLKREFIKWMNSAITVI